MPSLTTIDLQLPFLGTTLFVPGHGYSWAVLMPVIATILARWNWRRAWLIPTLIVVARPANAVDALQRFLEDPGWAMHLPTLAVIFLVVSICVSREKNYRNLLFHREITSS